jgi:hypothetical protein
MPRRWPFFAILGLTSPELAPVPTFTWKAIESVTIVVTPPVAAMLITIRTAIDRRVPEGHRNSRNIDPHSEIGMCLCRNAGTYPCKRKSSTDCNG